MTAQAIPNEVVSTTEWTDICSLYEITGDTGVCALYNDEQVAIFRLRQSEDLYAISNFDPFSKTNILSRGLLGSVDEKLFVASPLYKQKFNLATGECLDDDSVTLKTYQVRVDDGLVQIRQAS